jgi:hypothetical protein
LRLPPRPALPGHAQTPAGGFLLGLLAGRPGALGRRVRGGIARRLLGADRLAQIEHRHSADIGDLLTKVGHRGGIADLDVEQHRVEQLIAESPDRVGESDDLDDLAGAIVLAIAVASQGNSPGLERTSSRRKGWLSIDGASVAEASCKDRAPSNRGLRHRIARRFSLALSVLSTSG